MSHTALLATLQQEHTAVLGFIRLLEAEGEALSQRAAPAELGVLTDEKNRLADALQRLADGRTAVLAELGHAASHAGTVAAVQAAPATIAPQLTGAWRQLQEAGERARQLNERNGVFVRTHLRFTEDAMAALRSAATSTSPYDASGRTAASFTPARGRSRQA